MTSKRKSLHAPLFITFISRHIQAIRISLSQLSLSPIASMMTFAVIGIALALPFGLYALLQNVRLVSHSLHDSAQISLYLNASASSASINNLMHILQSDSGVQNVQYITPNAGLDEFQKNSDFNDVLTALKTNPLPAVLVIQPSENSRGALQIQQLLTRLKQLPNIENAQLDMQWLQRFNAILLLLHRTLLAVMLLFSFGVLLIIGNTIRLTTQHHRDEIFVVTLLGGTTQFIQRPFLYSGMIYGLSGSIVAWLLIDFSMLWLQSPVSQLSSLYGTNFLIQGLDLKITGILLASGCLLGLFGSFFAVRQQLPAFEPVE